MKKKRCAGLEAAATTDIEKREHGDQHNSFKRGHNPENHIVYEGKWPIKPLPPQCRP